MLNVVTSSFLLGSNGSKPQTNSRRRCSFECDQTELVRQHATTIVIVANVTSTAATGVPLLPPQSSPAAQLTWYASALTPTLPRHECRSLLPHAHSRTRYSRSVVELNTLRSCHTSALARTVAPAPAAPVPALDHSATPSLLCS